LPISIYLVVVLYRHKHCRPQKVELDLACRDSTTTNIFEVLLGPLFLSLRHQRTVLEPASDSRS
jgi:hypothetical protein